MKRASSKEAFPIFAPLLLPIECLSPHFFPSNGLREKLSFDKAFNLDCWLLADDHIKKEINLSFVYYQYLPGVKAK